MDLLVDKTLTGCVSMEDTTDTTVLPKNILESTTISILPTTSSRSSTSISTIKSSSSFSTSLLQSNVVSCNGDEDNDKDECSVAIDLSDDSVDWCKVSFLQNRYITNQHLFDKYKYKLNPIFNVVNSHVTIKLSDLKRAERYLSYDTNVLEMLSYLYFCIMFTPYRILTTRFSWFTLMVDAFKTNEMLNFLSIQNRMHIKNNLINYFEQRINVRNIEWFSKCKMQDVYSKFYIDKIDL